MNKNSKIFIAGHKGLVGSAILRLLQKENYENIITRTKEELDLRNFVKVEKFFKKERPDYVFLAAAKVAGIKANNQYPAEFLLENLRIQNNVIEQSYLTKVKKLIFLGSNCVYPRSSSQPMKEEYLFTGWPEPTNEGYAIAKLAGLRLVQYYGKEYGMKSLNVMPCSLFGPNDSFDPEKSHVITAMVKKFIDAKENKEKRVTFWGTGTVKREYLHVDDLARALLFLLDNYDSTEVINIGSGMEITIKQLSHKIATLADFKGKILWDTTKPDGVRRKCLDITKLKSLGFSTMIPFETGLLQVINNYRKK